MIEGGTFNGGVGDDSVYVMWDGTFDGGGGQDAIMGCVDSPPAVYLDVEGVPDASCTAS